MCKFALRINNLLNEEYMKKTFFTLVMVALSLSSAWGGNRIERPKLVVGLVVDQMRWDYLYYYYEDFCEGG